MSDMRKVTVSDYPFYDSADCHIPLWKDCDIQQVLKTPIFNINKIHREHPDGVRNGDFFQLKSQSWVNIIPLVVTEDGQRLFVVEKQFRHGSGEVALEFPAGIVEKGETPEESALRELWEETGLKAGKLSLMGKINPNPAFMSVSSSFFLAEDLLYTGERNLDENEEIQVMFIPEKDAITAMSAEHNTNGSMLIALFYYCKYTGIINSLF